jgi:hypothetical protein
VPLDDPRTRTEILEALGHVQAEVASYFGSLGAEFNQRTGDAWTPAEHLKHLVTSVNAVARGLAAPKLLLRLRFGRARAPSRSYAQVREAYRAALAAGGKASGAFVPPPEVVPAEDAGRRRAEILARWDRANVRLRGALERWTEPQLDRILMPHPLLGRLTTREMLFFTLYHNQHHVTAAQRRLAGEAAS